jgi:UPF0755 protein
MNSKRYICYILAILLVLSSSTFAFGLSAPTDYPLSQTYTVNRGEGLNSVARGLKNRGYIRSEVLFKAVAIFCGGTEGVKAGDYAMNERENSISLSCRFIKGDFKLVPIKITIPEGLNNREISAIFSDKFVNFDANKFLSLAKDKEGYLFPDTYLFFPNVTAEAIIKEMKENFDRKILTIENDIKKSGKIIDDIIKLASILELEARTTESRKMVSGILWRRLSLDMPLQVDASFKYINGKTTATLSIADLKLDSPYNSYTNKGLPPTPISNPGLDSIRAAIMPETSPYLYFLTGRDGKMYYASTYDKHLQNKSLYLK